MPYPIAACRGKNSGVDALLPYSVDFSSIASMPARWTTRVGTIAISSNAAKATAISGTGGVSGSGTAQTTIEAGRSDVAIEVTLNRVNPDGFYFGIIGRWQNASNYWKVIASTGGNGFRIYEVNAGTQTLRKFGNTGFPSGDQILSVAFSGSTISATFQSTTISYASATFQQTETKFGLYYESTQDKAINFFAGPA